MSALGILNEERTASSRLYAPFRSVFSAAVDQVIPHTTHTAAPADTTGTDTTWIEV